MKIKETVYHDKSVICDKCGHGFAINLDNCGEIHKGDITVQYFYCPECNAKYHICTTNTEMRKLISRRVAIQNKIAEGRVKLLPNGTVQKLLHELNKIIAKQKELMPT